ncbi:hypothetical protein AB0G00_23825 [Nocardia salmonicida]|uniref:hypothetical protein n=1 Tax=Nocardia salmonicida TaxID=53431 RepID=UPI0033D5C115
MAREFEGTLRFGGISAKLETSRPTMVNEDTGETFVIFPTELLAILRDLEVIGTWRVTNKGGVNAVRLINGEIIG